MKNLIRYTNLIILLAFTYGFTGEWHPVHESGNSMSINSIASRSIAFDLQIAVGDDGNIYRSWEAGRFWDFFNAGVGERLTDVVIFFDGGQDVTVGDWLSGNVHIRVHWQNNTNLIIFPLYLVSLKTQNRTQYLLNALQVFFQMKI